MLESVTLRVVAGEVLGLIGPNGSGKTTALRIMLGLLTPVSGAVRLFGVPPREFHEWRRVGYVPQRAALDAALPATAQELVESGLVSTLAPFRRPNSGARQRVLEVLGLVGMAAQARARIGALSIGQQQRVLIARAMVTEPDLLVLDEPTGGVDPEAQAGFLGLLRRLNAERGLTLILVSHDMGAVGRADVSRLAYLNRRVLFCGRPDDFVRDSALPALYGVHAS
ncbi:MAG TPA: metal ABC transporter ATP-binding protein [Methylomirabilota bacterium]